MISERDAAMSPGAGAHDAFDRVRRDRRLANRRSPLRGIWKACVLRARRAPLPELRASLFEGPSARQMRDL